MAIKNAVLNSCMEKVKSLNRYDEVKLTEIRYGLECLYLNISKLIVILLISYILGIAKYTILFLLLDIPIRSISFGFHANNSLECLIMSSLTFIFLPILAKYFTLNVITKSIIYSFIVIGFWIMAPKDTEKKPLNNNKKRLILKIGAVLLVVIYYILSLIIKNNIFNNLMLLVLLFQLFMISPIPFLVFGQKYHFKWFK